MLSLNANAFAVAEKKQPITAAIIPPSTANVTDPNNERFNMPKPQLIKEQEILEEQLIASLLDGLKQWRPDLNYPESHSDMQACVRQAMQMFEIKLRPRSEPVRIVCFACKGIGEFIEPNSGAGYMKIMGSCEKCGGRGWIPNQ